MNLDSVIIQDLEILSGERVSVARASLSATFLTTSRQAIHSTSF
jgi:hypothetical protein